MFKHAMSKFEHSVVSVVLLFFAALAEMHCFLFALLRVGMRSRENFRRLRLQPRRKEIGSGSGSGSVHPLCHQLDKDGRKRQ